jgi:hypothetical protein
VGASYAANAAEAPRSPWVTWTEGEPTITLYFFWSRTCPHCLEARPFVLKLAEETPWLELRDLEVSRNADNARRYVELAQRIDESARSVPAFVFCGVMLTGYDNDAGVGALLKSELESCYHQQRVAGPGGASTVAAPVPASTRSLPFVGEVDIQRWSLPLVAVLLGGLDSFNPCAFFVLLFLLSLLVNAGSRLRMLVVGGLFVVVSGVVYFLFMAAWLNLFLIVGQLLWVTIAAGTLALVIGLLNIKDFFWFKAGPSLGVPESAKPGLFRRMRGLVGAESWPAMLIGTFALAVVANAYELLCTAGLPMVFTRMLTLEPMASGVYYAYLVLYCSVYVIPLFVITSAFVFTLGRRKLTEREGRILKLVSGLMMAGLGTLLLVDPSALSNIWVTASLLMGALGGAWLLVRFAPQPG